MRFGRVDCALKFRFFLRARVPTGMTLSVSRFRISLVVGTALRSVHPRVGQCPSDSVGALTSLTIGVHA